MSQVGLPGEHFHRNTWAWRHAKLQNLPEGVRQLAVARLESIDQTDYKRANRFCHQLVRAARAAHVGKAFDEAEIRDCAENYARTCTQLRPGDPSAVLERLAGGARRFAVCEGPVTWLPVQSPPYGAPMRSFAAKSAFAATVGIDEIPANRSNRYFGLSARLDDPLWWRRQLRKVWSRTSEEFLRRLGAVRKGGEVYASEAAVRLRQAQQRRMRRFLENTVLVNELGESLSLEQLAEHSLSNPALRRGELMARLKGYERIAAELDWQGIFVTVTAPSAFHPQRFDGGANPRYEGGSVRDAQRWLCCTWSRVRAQLDRDGIRYFGIRVAEPHHDGTPHWHMLLFVQRRLRKDLTKNIVSGWLREYGTEPGAYKKRVTVKKIDPRLGSATGYLAKYIAKNLDAAGVIHAQEASETGVGQQAAGLAHGVDVADGLSRVLAWASVHGIRQFQQLGGPPVGLYREARRLREAVSDADLERARGYADRGDWRGFCLASGYRFHRDSVDGQLERLRRSENRRRRAAGLPPRRRHKTDLRMVYAETGRRNRYGELRPCQVIGLKWSAAELFTRPHSWELRSRGVKDGTVHINSGLTRPDRRSLSDPVPPHLGPVAITVRTSVPSGHGFESDVDASERFFWRTEALIRQLACQFRRSEQAIPPKNRHREAAAHRIQAPWAHQETTGPPH